MFTLKCNEVYEVKLMRDDESIFIFDPTIFYMYLTQIEEEAENLRKRQEVWCPHQCCMCACTVCR